MTIGISGNSKKFRTWKMGQINIQTCSDDHKVCMALQECKRANLDIVCFQEVRLLKSDVRKHEGYTFHWNGMQRIRRYGVAIAIRNKCNIVTDSIFNYSPRLMAADITVSGCKIRVISCHAPTESSTRASKEQFYRDLSKLSKVENHRKIIINGDFNAEPNFCRSDSRFIGNTTFFDNSNYSNENVSLFLQHCHSHELAIMNTWFQHPTHHRETWHSPDGKTKKVYDYCLAEAWLSQYITDVRVRNSYFHSDHRLVVTRLKTPANKAARRFRRRKSGGPRPNLQLLSSNNVRQNVTNSIKAHIDKAAPSTSLTEMHNNIIQALNKGREQIPALPKRNRNTIPWNTDMELTELHQTRTNLRKNKLTDTIKKKLKEVSKKIKNKVIQIKNKQLTEKGREINEAKQHQNMVKLWRKAKEHDSSSLTKAHPIQCPGLANHFKKHFNPDQTSLGIPFEILHTPQYIEILRNSDIPVINEPPSDTEIVDAIIKLNDGKSSIDVEAEVLKHAIGIPKLKESISSYFREIWTTKEVPQQWRISRITSIWKKKGNANDPTKYRGISIGSVLCKVAMNIILKRTSKFYENQLRRTQFGFRTGTGCNDGIFMLKQLQDIASLSQRPLFVCFVDLTAAFDHVNRDLLFKSIKKRLPDNEDTTNIDIIQNLYEQTKSYLQNQEPEDSFPTRSGVRQGGQEGPPLYNLYSDYSLRVYEERKIEAGVTGLCIPYHIPNEATDRAQRMEAPVSGICEDDDCGYADDLAVVCWSSEDLQTCMDILNRTFIEFGLQINLDKTETMIINDCNSAETQHSESIVKLNGKNLKNITSFKYLGVWISNGNLHIGKKELEYRIGSAYNAFAQNKKLLTNRNKQLETRLLFLTSLVKSRLTYGCHVWRPSQPEISKIESTYRHFLRSMIRHGHDRVNPPTSTQSDSSDEALSEEENDVDWRYVITNDQLYNITNTETIEKYYKKQRTQWVSHIIRRSNDNICKILLFHTVKRKKLGRKTPSLLEEVIKDSGMSYSQFIKASFTKQNTTRQVSR